MDVHEIKSIGMNHGVLYEMNEEKQVDLDMA